MFHQQAAFYPDEDFEPVIKRTGYKNEFLVFSREKKIKHLLLTCMPIKYYLCRIYETLSITYLGWTDLHAQNWQYFALSVGGFYVLLLVLSILLILTDNLFRVIHSDRKLCQVSYSSAVNHLNKWCVRVLHRPIIVFRGGVGKNNLASNLKINSFINIHLVNREEKQGHWKKEISGSWIM